MIFTTHNIRLDNGNFTIPDYPYTADTFPWFVSLKDVLSSFYGEKKLRIVDLGCLEGGYSVELARIGHDVTGIEIRQKNFEKLQYVKTKVDLPNLRFVHDDALNWLKYGQFDVILCYGLLYHLDKPKQFIQGLQCDLALFHTHYACDNNRFKLSEYCENEGLRGKWYTEYAKDNQKEDAVLSSYDNKQSFWLTEESLLSTLQNKFKAVGKIYSNDHSEIMQDRGLFFGKN